MEIFTCLIQIMILELLILIEVFIMIKLSLIFQKRVTNPEQQKVRNRVYYKIDSLSVPIEFFGTFGLAYFYQRDISNFIVDGISIIVFFGVLLASLVYREVYIKHKVETDVNKVSFGHAACVSDGAKGLFICALTNFSLQTYVYLSRISLVAALITFVFSVCAFIVVIPKLFRFVENRIYPELNA